MRDLRQPQVSFESSGFGIRKDKAMADYEQNAVSRAVWQWQASAAEPEVRNRPKQALIQFVVMVIISLVLFFAFDKVIMSRVVGGIAVVTLISGLFIHPVFDAIERFGATVGKHVSTGVTWLLLVPFFYIVFVPGRLIHHITGKDPLCRRFPTANTTYWVRRPPVENVDQYRKQH
jgi:hypothetical protein